MIPPVILRKLHPNLGSLRPEIAQLVSMEAYQSVNYPDLAVVSSVHGFSPVPQSRAVVASVGRILRVSIPQMVLEPLEQILAVDLGSRCNGCGCSFLHGVCPPSVGKYILMVCIDGTCTYARGRSFFRFTLDSSGKRRSGCFELFPEVI